MSLLIDCSYFTAGPRHIQNASMGAVPQGDCAVVNATIESYISEYQETFLIEMLGEEVGLMLNEYIQGDPQYALMRRVQKAIGRSVDGGDLRVVDNEEADTEANPVYDAVLGRLCESFADYVYYQIMKDSVSQVTTTGVVRLKSANTNVAPIRRQVNVWNRMVERNRRFVRWAQSKHCHVGGIKTSDNMLTPINVLNL